MGISNKAQIKMYISKEIDKLRNFKEYISLEEYEFENVEGVREVQLLSVNCKYDTLSFEIACDGVNYYFKAEVRGLLDNSGRLSEIGMKETIGDLISNLNFLLENRDMFLEEMKEEDADDDEEEQEDDAYLRQDEESGFWDFFYMDSDGDVMEKEFSSYDLDEFSSFENRLSYEKKDYEFKITYDDENGNVFYWYEY